MAIHIYPADPVAAIGAEEIELVAGAVRATGRVVLLAPSAAARAAVRRELAGAGVGLGVEVLTVDAWIGALWELLGDGRRIAAPLERQLLMAEVMAGVPDEGLAPLRRNPGTVRLLASMAAELLPYLPCSSSDLEASKQAIFSLLKAYKKRLSAAGLIEACDAARLLGETMGSPLPSLARWVALRDIDRLPAFAQDLLNACARGGEVVWLLDTERDAAVGAAIEEAAAAAGLPVERRRGRGLLRQAPPLPRELSFLEVAGPHARDRAYAEQIASLADGGASKIAVVAPAAGALFEALAPRLAALGIAGEVSRRVRFGETAAGRQLAALSDLGQRLIEAREGRADDALWWPAPEAVDWLYSPLSGAGAREARDLDRRLRQTRPIGAEGLMRQLQSIQGRVTAARAKLDPDHPFASVPAPAADVLAHLMRGRPVSACKAMLSVAEASPASAFGTADGAARARAERAVLERAIEVLGTEARSLGVSQATALSALDGLAVSVPVELAVPGARARARFLTPAEAACLPAGSVPALASFEMDIAGYPLAHEEGALPALAAELGAAARVVEPIACQRARFARMLAAAAGPVVLGRVTHDRQAKDVYPAAIWTELRARAEAAGAPACRAVGEGRVADDLDPASGAGRAVRREACLPPQELSPGALPYLVLRQRDPAAPEGTGPLVLRQLSASQIESYLSCPLCWFISNRVRPASLDAGFGGMEKGNFVHDVLHRFQQVLAERGIERVRRDSLEESLRILREVFQTVAGEHARGKTASSAALVPLSAAERLELADLLPQLERVIRAEAPALAPFIPRYLEFSFNGLGVSYAGRPLGGRIDRVDVDACGRAVVIDYKHRSGAAQFRLSDPTVVDARTGTAPGDDADWVPEHTQTLIYAQALRRADLDLDPQGALYFTTKGSPGFQGAVAAGLTEVEPGDGHVPGLKAGFPHEEEGGTLTFDALLDRVEEVVSRRLDALEAGDIRAAAEERPSCAHNHDLGFTRRDA
ncbi:MAG: PD-(D/E)XK nuclease family protein [Coriobacteriaceae bacterium]|nr:PD-(D/E)XK nuclease family protein [Coriobacteriaceae bacterium]